MRTPNFEIPTQVEILDVGTKVIYMPDFLKIPESDTGVVSVCNLGTITSKNSRFTFVRYAGKTGSQATNPNDIHSIEDREDLVELLEDEDKNT